MPLRLIAILLLLLSPLLGAAERDVEAPATGKAALIVIDTPIDAQTARYVQRALRQAGEAGATTIVTQITSPGGEVGACLDIVDSLLAFRRKAEGETVRLAAFVDGEAWSGGALTAYAHQQVYMTPRSHIGDIGVITMTPEGKIEYLPEKVESPLRAHFRTLSEENGWDQAKLLKMIARNQELYRFDLPDGQRFVIEDDLGQFLAAHPEVKPEQKVLVLGKDRLISYTAKEAVEAKMATAIADDLDAVWKALAIPPAQVIDLRPTSIERVAWALSGFASILASLAILCVILELKTPGIGIWAALAGVFGTAFFICQYYQDLAGNIELVLVGLGVLAIVAELLFLPTGGILGFGGLAIACTGLLMAFMPNEITFNSAGFGEALASAFRQCLMAFIVVTIGIAIFIRSLPGSRAAKRIAATAEIAATSAGALETSAASLVGRRVQAVSDLRPSGQVAIDGDTVSATAEHGEYISAGTTVEIVAMRFGELIVRPAPAGGSA